LIPFDSSIFKESNPEMTTSVGVFLNDSWISTKPLDERFVGIDMTVEMMMNIHELDANMDGGTVVSYSYEKTMGVTIDNGHFNVQVDNISYPTDIEVKTDQWTSLADMLISWSLTKSGIMGPSPVGKFHPIVNPSCGPKIPDFVKDQEMSMSPTGASWTPTNPPYMRIDEASTEMEFSQFGDIDAIVKEVCEKLFEGDDDGCGDLALLIHLVGLK
jgi:hypothetical protein